MYRMVGLRHLTDFESTNWYLLVFPTLSAFTISTKRFNDTQENMILQNIRSGSEIYTFLIRHNIFMNISCNNNFMK